MRKSHQPGETLIQQQDGDSPACWRDEGVGCSAMNLVRELEDSKVPAIFGQRSAILPNGRSH